MDRREEVDAVEWISTAREERRVGEGEEEEGRRRLQETRSWIEIIHISEVTPLSSIFPSFRQPLVPYLAIHPSPLFLLKDNDIESIFSRSMAAAKKTLDSDVDAIMESDHLLD